MNNLKKGQHGGARPGAGMPKGYKTQKTLAKEAAREVLVAKVLAELGPLVDAQIKNALGISFLVVRERRAGSSFGSPSPWPRPG